MPSKSPINLSSLNPVERFFCSALSGDAAEVSEELMRQYREVGDEAAWQFAQREKCMSIVGAALGRSAGGNEIPKRWRDAAQEVGQRIGLYLEQLDRVAAALAEKGIPLVALKNSGIARGIYRDLAGCPMGDIDVLVRPGDFRGAHETLLGLGYELGDRSPFDLEDLEAAIRHGGTEYTCTLSDGSTLWIELQWRPVAGRWIQPDQEPPADELMARAIPIEGSAARLLSPEDNLQQVCLHTAKHSYVRAPGFRLHTDVDRITRAYDIDWDAFCKRVEQMQVRTPVYLSLFIPSVLFHTPVPANVLQRLNHAPLKHRMLQRWLRKVGLFGPHDRKWSKPGYILFNLMLYDGLKDVWRAVFPDRAWMIEHYGTEKRSGLLHLYVNRILGLITKRAAHT
jgi:hypothetical protein